MIWYIIFYIISVALIHHQLLVHRYNEIKQRYGDERLESQSYKSGIFFIALVWPLSLVLYCFIATVDWLINTIIEVITSYESFLIKQIKKDEELN